MRFSSKYQKALRRGVLTFALLGSLPINYIYAQKSAIVSGEPKSIFTTEAAKEESKKNVPTLNDHLLYRRKALLQLQSLPSNELQPITLEARTTAEQRAGVRRIRIRGFQIISDSETNFAGYSLGPGSPESQVAIIASDLADSYLNQAAIKGIPLDSLKIEIINRPDSEPTNRVSYPRNFLYTAYIKSSASDEQLEELRQAAERNSAIFNFIQKPQIVTGDINYEQTPQEVIIPEGGQPGLREYLKYKRIAYLHLQAEAQKREEERKNNPITIGEKEPTGPIITVDSKTGVRRLQIRQFQILHDNPTYLAGSDLGPSSKEHQLGVLTSCLTHIFLIQAAAGEIPLDSLEVSVKGTTDIRAGRAGFEKTPSYPYDIHYTVHVKSPAPIDQIEKLRDKVESVCPIYNLLKDEQTIEGKIVRVGK
ncbi:MAG: OsmC family protein [Dysgonomonas sp.]